MNMSPIKKFVLGLAATAVVLALIATNGISSLFDYMTANDNKIWQNAVIEEIADHNSSGGGSSNNGYNGGGSYNPGNSGGSGNNSTNTGNGGGSSQGSQNTQTPGGDKNDGGSQSAGVADSEGLKMYVDAINKAKTSATSVVKTKTSASHYKEHLVINGNAIVKATLEPIGKSLMGTFMTASEPNETIDKNELPPKGIQCSLTSADLQEAPKVEKSGDNTVVTLVLKGGNDPKPGSGLGSAISIIEDKTITDAVNGAIEISDIHLEYDPCTIVATIDASGNLVALSVNAPCILKLTAMGVGAEVGIECYDEFTIAY